MKEVRVIPRTFIVQYSTAKTLHFCKSLLLWKLESLKALGSGSQSRVDVKIHEEQCEERERDRNNTASSNLYKEGLVGYGAGKKHIQRTINTVTLQPPDQWRTEEPSGCSHCQPGFIAKPKLSPFQSTSHSKNISKYLFSSSEHWWWAVGATGFWGQFVIWCSEKAFRSFKQF